MYHQDVHRPVGQRWHSQRGRRAVRATPGYPILGMPWRRVCANRHKRARATSDADSWLNAPTHNPSGAGGSPSTPFEMLYAARVEASRTLGIHRRAYTASHRSGTSSGCAGRSQA